MIELLIDRFIDSLIDDLFSPSRHTVLLIVSVTEHSHFLLGTVDEEDTFSEERSDSIDFAGSPKSDHINHLRHSVTSVNLAPTTSFGDGVQRDTVDAAVSRSVSRQRSVQSNGATNIIPFPL